MPKRPTKEQRLELAIEAIDFRLEQLGDMLIASNCVLCKAYQKIDVAQTLTWDCKGCPAKKSKYSCHDFQLAVKEIRISLGCQKIIFSRRLNKLIKEES
ncbi:MAG: hypothetical protein OEX09_02005 [Candidatus Bathyarchaeota archaeon]|nr:hypothetical protein [Candidatus Bathyarchaeota archaeon]